MNKFLIRKILKEAGSSNWDGDWTEITSIDKYKSESYIKNVNKAYKNGSFKVLDKVGDIEFCKIGDTVMFDQFLATIDEDVVLFFKNKSFVGYLGYDLVDHINMLIGYPQIKFIEVVPLFKGNSIGLKAYEFLIKKFGGVVSDNSQSEGGRRLWEKMLQNHKVYAINPIKNKVYNVKPGDIVSRKKLYATTDVIFFIKK